MKFSLVFVIASLRSMGALADSPSRNRFSLSSIISKRSGENRRGGTADAWVELFSSSTRAKSYSSQQRGNNQNQRNNTGEPPRRTISKQTFASTIAFTTGMADVFVFRMNGCMGNLMTGNTMKSASALGTFRLGDAWNVATLVLCYAFGNIMYRSLVHFHHHDTQPAHTSARLSASPLILLAFGCSDLLFYTKGFGTDGYHFGHLLPLTLGFGLLNAAITDALDGTMLHAYTGHISKISQGISDWLFAADSRKRRFNLATRLSVWVLGFFVAGIIAGAILSTAGTDSIIMPASGLIMPAFLVAHPRFKVPLLTLVGIVYVALIQLYDRPLPNNLPNIGDRRQQTKSKVDVSSMLWSR